ncbi:hypothetical protein BRETT_005250 [Brettanomyces bruxellensis]|uniref:Phosphatidic acid phosphatase type 2/haloperoxidase domain-containing protein n=1 Tax=Dekkera bruxellensis TaxID=5007 RepID=A0A871R3G9_DEKBR|nr:uncharacterized protein BRETT_005250 [Brettanomyces bruxellensis]QOU18188.1 hypothetical protein BRETT_005250 [Brettanomyces bruxellensis]
MKMKITPPAIDRQTFGLVKSKWLHTLYKWKLIDASYAIILVILDATVVHWAHPYERQFTINDITISHPFAEHEHVPASMLLILILAIPPVVFFVVDMLFTPRGHRLYLFYISYLGFAVSVTTCDLIVETMKNWIGRCRPDFLARCIPSDDAVADTLYYASEICTTKNVSRLLDGFRTTPSGHSSMAFSCFGYLTLWMLGQFLGCSCNYVGAWRFLVSFVPSLFAAYVACSRTQDYRHHFVDVILGSSIGWLMAWWSYRRYFPSVFNRSSYVPSIILDISKHGLDDIQTHDFYNEHSSDMEGFDLESRGADISSEANTSSTAPLNYDRDVI